MQKEFIGTVAIFLHLTIPAFACLPTAQLQQQVGVGVTVPKITFNLSNLSDGLVGSPDGLRSISYEFCIPANEQHLAEVQSIDPTIVHFAHSRGRIGCRPDQYLCIGGRTRNAQWREILLSIARLDYVDRIDRFFGE